MMLAPSREEVRRYQSYARQVSKLAHTLNARYTGPDGPTVVPVVGNDQARALAAMRTSDVMLVNSIIDGMHLGAKEFAAVNESNGVLVLSRTAGVAYEPGEEAAFHITPTDIQETADALYRALTMNKEERAAMAGAARHQVESHPITSWIDQQLRDVTWQAWQDEPPVS
jgi:trehalose 6-phosphate synthase